MKISDEERRKVARKLRSLDESIGGVPLMCTKQEHNAMALRAIRAVVGKGDVFQLAALALAVVLLAALAIYWNKKTGGDAHGNRSAD